MWSIYKDKRARDYLVGTYAIAMNGSLGGMPKARMVRGYSEEHAKQKLEVGPTFDLRVVRSDGCRVEQDR